MKIICEREKLLKAINAVVKEEYLLEQQCQY